VGTHDLQVQILSVNLPAPDTDLDQYLTFWHTTYAKPIPIQPSASKQNTWDKPEIDRCFAHLLQQQADDHNRARLLAASSKHSGDWLHAIPITACGLRLDDNAIRTAVGLRLGTEICQPHPCICGTLVNVTGSHALCCKRSSGKFIRHNNINDIVHRALTRAGVPATKEPNGLNRTDGKRPDGLTLIPWREGRCLIWDVTVADTTAVSYVNATATIAGSAAETAASRKETKYAELSNNYEFVPIAIETLGSFGSKALSFLSELGRRTSIVTSDVRETSHLFQKLSIAIQRFNSVCLLETFASCFDDSV
jgi:hypothetical protein